MIDLRRNTLAFLLCASLVPLVACSRTSDGTVVMKKPPAISTLMPSWARRKQRRAEPVPVAVAQFPPVPSRAAQAGRPRAKPLVTGPKANLACANQTEPGGRVRVVCK